MSRQLVWVAEHDGRPIYRDEETGKIVLIFPFASVAVAKKFLLLWAQLNNTLEVAQEELDAELREQAELDKHWATLDAQIDPGGLAGPEA